MPLYRVQLKQGSRTIVNHIEAKSVQAVLDFFNTLTTMKVSEILEVKYQDKSQPPIDDFNYRPLFKAFIRNDESHKSKQIILHNIKKSKNENDIYQAIQQYLEIDGQRVDTVVSQLFKL